MKVMTNSTGNKSTEFKPQVKINLERCAGCQECLIRCPTAALSMDLVNWKVQADNGLCVGCRQCQRSCPFSAITVVGPRVVAERVKTTLKHNVGSGPGNEEIRAGFANLDEAVKEAERCLNCPDPTCARGCPAHNDIPRFIEAIRNRNLELAKKIISETSCLPDICSRVCNWEGQCEGACNWSLAGSEPVAIGKLERFVTDNTSPLQLGRISERGKGLSVAIIGSGPAGIAAAWELASAGATVTIYDRDKVPGGVIQWGIPLYVLPDKVARRPVRALEDAGIKFNLNKQITPRAMEDLLSTHDAVIAAFGAPVPASPKIPGENLEGVVDATTFLNLARKALVDGVTLPELQGARILVLGGSNTALDVARNVIRLGGKPVMIHREEEMFSFGRRDEIDEAKKEGIEIRFATNVTRLEGEGGKVRRAGLIRTSQKRADKIPVAIQGTDEVLEIDRVVIAIGYRLDQSFCSIFPKTPLRQPLAGKLFPDRRWLGSGLLGGKNRVGNLAWDREYGLRSAASPQNEKLWLVGDALVGPSTVVGSMAQGRQAARAVLARRTRK